MINFIRHPKDTNETLINLNFIEEIAKGEENTILFYRDVEADSYSYWEFENEQDRDVAFENIITKINS